jgi:TonB family protein
MNRILGSAIPLSLLLVLAAAPPPPPPQRAAPLAGSLPKLLTSDDYPNAALRNEEQGIVEIRLDVDAAGHVTSCTVTASSGSDSLDTTTCRLMIERARFTPARNRRGHAVPDKYVQKIGWRISVQSVGPPTQAAADAWIGCVRTAASALAAGVGSEDAIAAAAFSRCSAEERALIGPPIPGNSHNEDVLHSGARPLVTDAIRAARAQRR